MFINVVSGRCILEGGTMNVHTDYLVFETKKQIDFVNITRQVEHVVEKSGIREGMALVNPMHITASVYINDAESGLLHDFEKWLEKLAPKEGGPYKHKPTRGGKA